jgi:phosphoglycerate dehydrogenase-like enzyme
MATLRIELEEVGMDTERRVVVSQEANLTDDQLDRIRAAAGGASVDVCDRETTGRLAPQSEILTGMGSAIPQEIFRQPGSLRWVNLFHAGADNLLCPELIESDIVVTSAKGAHVIPIAEHVFAFMLAHVKQLARHRDAQLRRSWERKQLEELHGKTLCVVGLGNIGAEIARRADCFGMRVVGTRRTVAPLPGVERVESPVRLRDLLPEADYVVLTLPYTAETTGMIGAQELAIMKSGAVLINVGRGQVVDQEALVEALKSGHLGGAGLDATDPEPLPPDSELWLLPNVTITPHNSGWSRYTRDRSVTMFCDNLRRYLRGEPLRQVVDKRAGY